MATRKAKDRAADAQMYANEARALELDPFTVVTTMIPDANKSGSDYAPGDDSEVIPLERVDFVNGNEFLATSGLIIGTTLTNGPLNGGEVVGLYAVAMGFMIEIRMPSGDVKTVLHRGDGAGVLA